MERFKRSVSQVVSILALALAITGILHIIVVGLAFAQALPVAVTNDALSSAIFAVGEAHTATEKYMAAAGLGAIALKYIVDAVLSWMNAHNSPGKQYVPWVMSVSGLLIAMLTKYAGGASLVDAIILGGAAPGAVLWNELMNAFGAKPTSNVSNVVPMATNKAAVGGSTALLVGLGLMHMACGTVMAPGHYVAVPPDPLACAKAALAAYEAQKSCDVSPPPPVSQIINCAVASLLAAHPCAPTTTWVADPAPPAAK